MTFAENLKDLRTKARLSQSQLAAQTGIPVKTIQAWEISRRAPRWIGMLLRLARGLHVPMEKLAMAAEDDAGNPRPGRRRKGRP